jgi:hypothetical protein
MIGRGLRGEKVGGSQSFKLIDVKDNIESFGEMAKVYTHFREYWKPPEVNVTESSS